MARIFVGNLPIDIKERELDDLFYKFGRIRRIDIKTPSRPPAYAFIEYDDKRDAEDAVDRRDGYKFGGDRLRVEFSKGRDSSRDRGGRDRDRDRDRGRERKYSEYAVVITNLPRCSWQDLKDYMRKAGFVSRADVDNATGEGICDYTNREDMENALDTLDDTEFTLKHSKESGRVIRVKRYNKDNKSRSRSRDASRSRRSRSRDSRRSRSRDASRSRSRSRSLSPDKDDKDKSDDR